MATTNMIQLAVYTVIHAIDAAAAPAVVAAAAENASPGAITRNARSLAREGLTLLLAQAESPPNAAPTHAAGGLAPNPARALTPNPARALTPNPARALTQNPARHLTPDLGRSARSLSPATRNARSRARSRARSPSLARRSARR